jgi:hypothetical protein
MASDGPKRENLSIVCTTGILRRVLVPGTYRGASAACGSGCLWAAAGGADMKKRSVTRLGPLLELKEQ